jgi:glyoxylase-like metal-dependent hydrolase (beta-lactamase superfamily II)
MLHTDVAKGIHRVADSYVNWYIVEENGRLGIVDAGVPTSWKSLTYALKLLGRNPTEIEAIVLTHGHFDHIGFAERARSEYGIPVLVHENDVPLTRHPLQYARERSPMRYLLRRRTLPITASLVRSRAFFPEPIKEINRYAEGVLSVPGSPHVVFTPGHSLGHCALHFPDRDAVIAGDALVTFDLYTAKEGPQIVSRAATADSERALSSLDELEATGASTLLPGHGIPWTEGAADAVGRARAAGVS